MENPGTWGPAENVVSAVLAEFFANLARGLTYPGMKTTGLPLERLITDALREAGLLTETSQCRFCGAAVVKPPKKD